MKTPAINSRYINTIPVIISCSLISALVYFYQWTFYFSPLILGIIAGGLVDLDNGLTGKLKNLFATLLAFAVSSLTVQITFHNPIVLTAAMTVLAFIFTFSGAVGTRFRTISFGTLAVAVYTALSHQPDAPLYLNSALILAGTLLYSGSAVLVHMMFPHRPVQENMANAYEHLARYLDIKSEFFNPDETSHLEAQHMRLAVADTQVITAFNQVRAALFYRMRGQHRHTRTIKMLRYYFIAQDIHERSSSSHLNYQDFAEQMRFTDLIFRLQLLLRWQAQAARDFAKSLRGDHDYSVLPQLERASKGAQQSLQRYAHHHSSGSLKLGIAPYRIQRLLDNIDHIGYQLIHLSNPHAEKLANNHQIRLQAPEISSLKGAFNVLRHQISPQSPTFRHAVRMSLIAFLCCSIIQFTGSLSINHYSIGLGFWILLTAIFVCQPNYSATKKRLIQRIIGTVAGVLVGSALPIFSLTLAHKLAIATLTTILFFYFRTNKHSYATFFITIQALMGFSILDYDITSFFGHRIFDTLVGTTIAGLVTYFLWPDWKYLSLEKTTAQAIRSNADYLNAVLYELRHGICNNMHYHIALNNSHDKAAALSSILSDMSSEPEKHNKHLQNGFFLLKINYSLISYISALGAYRDTMHHDESDFMEHFYPAAESIVQLIKQLPDSDESTFQAAYQSLQYQLETLRQYIENKEENPEHTDNQDATLWQQLLMINELLSPCYQALHAPNPE